MTHAPHPSVVPSAPAPAASAVTPRRDADRKSNPVAYLLWFLLGGFGVHRFYLGRNETGILMAACTLLGTVAFLPLLVTAVVWLWDLFAIPAMVRRANRLAADEAGLADVF